MEVKKYKIMRFQKFLSYFRITESSKENRLDQILDKISKKSKLTPAEQNFLDNFEKTNEDDIMDYKMLDKETTFSKIENLLNTHKKVMCNLYDKDGKIGLQIISIFNDFGDESCIMTMKNGEKIKLQDNFLYNIIYSIENDEYSLESEDEYYEKIPTLNRP